MVHCIRVMTTAIVAMVITEEKSFLASKEINMRPTV